MNHEIALNLNHVTGIHIKKLSGRRRSVNQSVEPAVSSPVDKLKQTNFPIQRICHFDMMSTNQLFLVRIESHRAIQRIRIEPPSRSLLKIVTPWKEKMRLFITLFVRPIKRQKLGLGHSGIKTTTEEADLPY